MFHVHHFIQRINSIGWVASDSAMVKAAKNLLVYLAFLMSFGGLVWGSLLLYFDLRVAAIIPFGYIVLSFFNVLHFSFRKNFITTSIIQIFISMLLPFLLQWQLGGFFASGCVMLWSILSLVGSVVLLRGRWVYPNLLLYICFVVISYFFDSYFVSSKPAILTPEVSLALLALNILLIMAIVFVLAKIKVDQDHLIQNELLALYEVYERNLTTEQDTRRRLQTSETRFRILIEESRVLICTHSIVGNLITINKPGAEILGYNTDELLGKNISFLLPHELQDDYHSYLDHIVRHKAFEGFMTVLTRNGDRRILLFRNVLVEEQGQTPYIIGSAQDVTEWRKSENREGKIRKELQMIVSSMDDIVIEFDEARRFKNFWCRDESKLSRPVSHYIGKTLAEAFSYAPPFADKAQYVYEKVIQSGKPYSVEIDSKILPIPVSYLIRLNPIVEKDGNVKRCTALVSDITVRKLAEKELNESFKALKAAKEEAENSNRLKTIFLGNLSHEVRTPLQGILGFAEILENPKLPEAKRKEYLSIIKRRTGDMQNIIESLLDLASLETGEIKAFPVKINLYETIEYIFAKATQDLDLAGKPLKLLLENKLQLNDSTVLDPQHLLQVLTNLFSNAVKFTAEGSITLRCEYSLDRFKVSMIDSGIGIPADKVDHIFEPFRQAHEGMSRSKGGIGLGLAICKKMVQMWGGEIEVASQPGRGSVFSFTVPFEHSPALIV
jgi:PAS domain S-box-containing protein